MDYSSVGGFGNKALDFLKYVVFSWNSRHMYFKIEIFSTLLTIPLITEDSWEIKLTHKIKSRSEQSHKSLTLKAEKDHSQAVGTGVLGSHQEVENFQRT